MKRYILLLFIVIVGFSVDDVQKELITLEWAEIDGQAENDALVFFENLDSPQSAGRLPVYTRLYNLENNDKTYRFIIENPVFEELDPNSSNWNNDDVQEELSFTSQVLNSKDSKKVELQITPLKKENGKIYRLISFELKRISNELKSAIVQPEWKSNSVLNSGKWVKIGTSGKGIYKIPYSKLSEWGFAKPEEVGVFGSGASLLSENPGEVAYDDIEQCAVWSNSNGGEECLFFYAPGFIEWTATSEGYFQHTLNDYANSGYFFLGEVGGSQKNLETINEPAEPATLSTATFDEVALHEDEFYNILPLGSGKLWLGDKYLKGSSRSYNLSISNIDNAVPAKLRVNGAARSYLSSSMGVSAGGNSLGEVQFSKVNTNDSYGLYASKKNNVFEFNPSNGALSVECVYNTSNTNAEAWLDYIELNYKRKLIVENEVVFYRDWQSIGEGNIVEFSVESANSNTKILDVSDINNVTHIAARLDGSNLKAKCRTDELKEYALFNTDGTFKEPAFVSEIDNQNLHAINTPEFLIVSHSDFMSSAEDLAAFHRAYDGMNVEVVDAEKVYNEFSSGTKSATGIRNFIKMFYDRGNALKYVLLFGTGSYDNKGIKSNTKNFIPTFQSDESLYPTYSFVTDDYFVMLDPDESVYKGSIDLGIGRIPSATPYEAQLVVDKIKRYYEPQALGDWRNTICFIGDDGDGALHMRQSEEIANSINERYGEFITDKIYLDAFVKQTTPAGDRYPDVNLAIDDRVKDGVLILNYIGHANERFMAHEQVLTISEINSWSNTNQLPIFVTATCEFSRFDTDETSAGEYILLNPNGGGIGLFSTTRVVYASENFKLSKSLYNHIFEQDAQGEHYRMGDVMRLAKTNISSGINKRNFSLLADPALKLSYPKYRVVTNTLNKQNANVITDTIGTLQEITVTGHIADYFGNKLDDFNGELIPTVFDKAVEMETLGNKGERPMKFTVQENIIYKGRASVRNGDFTFSFVVPLDISYSLGEGKIMYYADNGKDDAHGAYTNFYIGGEGSDVTDNKGPDIQLFLDTYDFESGDLTGKNPTLLANLSDENGINTVGTGIGHDITAVLDNDYSRVFVLNNYYQAEKDDYTKGTLQFPLRDLSAGIHTLRLKAWDVANNSSEVEIEFEVTGDFVIDEISNYPNPVSDYTYFVLKHNQSDTNLDVIFDIYDQSGRRIDQFQQQIGSSGGSTNPIRWDLKESRIAATAGIYVYRAIVKNSDGIITSKSGKMIVVR